VQCTPGQPAAAGLSGLDGLGGFLDNLTGGDNNKLMLYGGLALAAYFLFFKKK
jgi:LPXTG-motif cell wall-anchored protein